MKQLFFVFSTALMLVVTSCSEEENQNQTAINGQVRFELTDAPIDDASVQACFITLTDVLVDGESISNFNGKQSIDLLAYQNGDVKSLGLANLEAGTYSNVSLVLDYETDANGNSPGCYVLTEDNIKHDLYTETNVSNTLSLSSKNFEVREGNTTNIVMDFDVRKGVKRQNNNSDQYSFVTKAELEAAIRYVEKENTGTVEGKCRDDLNLTSRIVVYSYKKGTYNKEVETQGQGSSQIQFKNAVSSAVVDENGNYTLAFLEEGVYELHFFGYEDRDNDGQMELQGELSIDLLANLGLNLNDLQVEANTQLTIEVMVTGVLPI